MLAVAIAVIATTAPAAHAQAEPTSWLCLPGQQPNPCAGDQTTTVFAPDGTSTTRTPKVPADPKVDCFYVYPTVSDQPGQNADRSPDPPIAAIAKYQAQRFSQICKVYAPIYRQRTVLGIFNPTTNSAEAGRIAYGDVLQAWRDYLANHNRGRGVVLIGHSQGTFHLRRLIAEEIEPRPAESAKLISGLLIGGNVLVRKGSTTGGDFQRTPACTGSTQVGCVVAYSTFNRTPPGNTRFGKYTPPPGAPNDKEVLCTNPAALSGGTGPVTTEVPSERFPAGLIALSLTQFYAGNQPTAPTPWLQPKERYTARCVREQNTNTLRLASVGGSRQPSPSPDESWGLHIGDVNLAMGNLVELARGQSRAYLAAEARQQKAACLARGGMARRKALGKARVGGTRTAARRVLTGRRVTGRTGVDRYCVAGGGSLRLYYPTRRSDARTRRRLANKALLALATSRKFSVRGVRPGTRTAMLKRRVRGGTTVRVGKNRWYLARGRSATLAFQLGGNRRVRAVGLAARSLTKSPRASRALLRTWR
ncbi:MAG TPA: DUF3089 domain-containing protein [Thermoleophilaceae bacterium]|nr:DUF3089 domain-containing protein [Thermoleophilaceae bacterium]